jgi:bifunctional UDP-N-acetylglucosamine pyrophosphorylase/glucosamine-1-phosphate N-acetyltransferase
MVWIANLKVFILAAGEGQRMKPLTETRPKVMLSVGGKPILGHLLETIVKAGFRDVGIIIGYRNEVIRRYFGNGAHLGLNIKYIWQESQLGTANAVIQVENEVENEPFILINGDVLTNVNNIIGLSTNETLAMAIARISDPTGLGIVETIGGRVVRIHEKSDNPPSDLANAGMYVLTSEIFQAIRTIAESERGEYELTDALQKLIDGGAHVKTLMVEDWWDVGYPWHLLEANERILRDIKSEIKGEIENGVVVKGDIIVDTGSKILAGSYLQGPIIIGKNCCIGPNSYIRPSTSIGDNCRVGAAVEIKNSIVMNDTKIPHHNYVGDSIIGEKCNLGSGTKIANLRIDGNTVRVNGIDSHRRKLGAIIGDCVETGINCSINVGTIIGSYSQIGPSVLVHGVLETHSRRLK